ncbi:hypothetical protein BDR04DRAFT_1147091 [Suillus decipiens]|nr:hypothetical protein BDR04DRAFT_1147091 [Suillus decipiens]
MKPYRQTKKNSTQDALKSQAVNVMAPEVKWSKPRPRPVKPKSKAHSPTPEYNSSPVNNLPNEDNNMEDDSEAAHSEGLGACYSSADNSDPLPIWQTKKWECTVSPSTNDDICSSRQVPDDSHAKKWRHTHHISPTVDEDNIYTPPQTSNNTQVKMVKLVHTIFSDHITLEPQIPDRYHAKKFKKNAHPITPSADDDSIQRCRSIKSCIAHKLSAHCSISSDDIPSPPHRAPKPVRSSTSLDAIHNVLQEHHAKNQRPHTPNPRTLQKLHQQTVKEPSDGEEDEEPQAVQPCKRSHPANKVYQTIMFYLHSWKDVLETAKKKLHLCLVMSGASSSHENFINKTSIEYLMETLEDFATDNISVETGIWDEHKHDMAIIVHMLSLFPSMKKAAHPIAATKYNIIPTDIHDDNEYTKYVCGRVEDLLDSGSFLHDGIDEQGRTNNLTNDALGVFCSTFFYRSEHALTKSFPDEFTEAIPEGAVALAATVVYFNLLTIPFHAHYS